MTARLAAAYAGTLANLADETARLLLAAFDDLDGYDPPQADEFHDATQPLVTASATAAQQVTGAYLVAIGTEPSEPSPLIVADAAARLYDPFDRLAHNLANGMGFTDALAGARSQAEALGDDTVFRTSRYSLAQMGTSHTGWQRRLASGCCQWCMKLSTVVFDSAGQATFGHAHCRCIPVPSGVVDDHNAALRDSAGFDAKAEDLYDQRHARRRMRGQVTTAQRRQAEAQRELLIEADPARRERLETRAMEWETRAEAAAERLRILETGTHRIAA